MTIGILPRRPGCRSTRSAWHQNCVRCFASGAGSRTGSNPRCPSPRISRSDHESNRGETEAEADGVRGRAGREDRRLEGRVSQPVRRALPAGRTADRQGGRGRLPGSARARRDQRGVQGVRAFRHPVRHRGPGRRRRHLRAPAQADGSLRRALPQGRHGRPRGRGRRGGAHRGGRGLDHAARRPPAVHPLPQDHHQDRPLLRICPRSAHRQGLGPGGPGRGALEHARSGARS